MWLVDQNCDQLICWCWPGRMKFSSEVSCQLGKQCPGGCSGEGSITERSTAPHSQSLFLVTRQSTCPSHGLTCRHALSRDGWFGSELCWPSGLRGKRGGRGGRKQFKHLMAKYCWILVDLWKAASLISSSCRYVLQRAFDTENNCL